VEAKLLQTFRSIDWNSAWNSDRVKRSEGRNREYWNRRAPSFAQHIKEGDRDEYVDPFVEIVDPQPEWSVLDVGCGPGTLSCPLAKVVRHVTAIDFSPVMIEILKARSEREGISNIVSQVASWEDDWHALGIMRHDVAIASRSLDAEDPQAFLSKLMSFATQRVYISFAVGSGPFDHRILEAVGRETQANPDYIYIYNLLYQMGIAANISLIEKSPNTFSGEEEAVDSFRWMIDNMTSAEEEALRRFLSRHLIQDGARWKLDYHRAVFWAVIWWKIRKGS
jgi:SAM-dependent methyltransferase